MKYATLVLLLGLQLLVGCASTARLKPEPPGSAPASPADLSKTDPAEHEMNPPPAIVLTPEPLQRDTVPPPAFKIDTLITLAYGPCRGKCPVYRLSVTNDGMVFWNGLQYAERTGLHFTRLQTDQKDKLESWVASALQSGLLDHYPGNEEVIVDFPTKSFTLKLNNRVQQIEVNHSPPRQLVTIEKQLLSWLDQADWRPVPAK